MLLKRAITAIAAAIGLTSAAFGSIAFARATEVVSIPPVVVDGARAAPMPLNATLQLPPGTGPYPIVILLHGCGGPNKRQQVWADRLESWGFASLQLDSFSARDVKNVCAPADQPLVTVFDRSADVIAAARWLQTVRGVDGNRIAAIGMSHGGGTVMRLASRGMEASEGGLIKGVVNYYGSCRAPTLHGTIPVLALAGQDDTWGNPAETCLAYASAVAGQQPVTVQTYPGVVHLFDDPRMIKRRLALGHPLQYDRAAAEDSFQRVHAFLDAIFSSKP